MENLQAFINNSIAYHIIIEKAKSLKHPVQSIKKNKDLKYLLSDKASVSTITNLNSLKIDKQTVTVLEKIDNNFPALPLLLAYNHYDVLYSERYSPIKWIKATLSDQSFITTNDLWTFFDVINNIESICYDSYIGLHTMTVDYIFHKNEIKKIILDHLPNSDERKAYEQAKLKLLLQKGA